jgi:hypothetical protein
LPFADWRDTCVTLQLWTQVVGKVRLALSPWLNHGWQVPLYVTARGLGTAPMHVAGGILEIDFDFRDHRLSFSHSDRPARGFALEPMSVARFYRRVMEELDAIGIDVAISTLPNEVPQPIRFPEDELHASYDAAAVQRFWRALIDTDRVFRLFRTGFLGKSSPVHFFWGSFDLAVTRFSGRAAPPHPGGVPGLPDEVTREAYSHQVSSAGFWPGSDAHPHPAFYSYAWPAPAGFDRAAVQPGEAAWSTALGEWLLPYDAVRQSSGPDETLMRFLQTTYRAAADLAGWDPALDCATGVCGKPREIPEAPAAERPQPRLNDVSS